MTSESHFLSLSGEEIDTDEWYGKIIKFLKEKKKASFQEIAKELKLEGSGKEILSMVLGLMLSERIIASETKSIPIEDGLVLTRMYQTTEEEPKIQKIQSPTKTRS